MPVAERYSRIWWSAFLLALGLGARARAEEPLALTWSAPPGCPGASQVLQRVRRLAGVTPVGPQLRAEVRIERAAEGGLRLQLVTYAGALRGERVVEGNACEDLANTVAIHLALLLQGVESSEGAVGSAPPTAADIVPERAPEAVVRTPESIGGTVSQEDAAQMERSAGAGVEDSTRHLFGLLQLPLMAASIGPLPRPSPGLALAGGIQFERLRVLVEAQAWLGQRLTSEREPGLGADLDRVSGHVRVCRALGTGAWELAPCALVGASHMWARGSGSHLAARSAQSTWITAGAGAQLRYALASWLGVTARVDAQLQLSRPRLSVGGLGDIGQLGPAAFSLTLGAEWIL